MPLRRQPHHAADMTGLAHRLPSALVSMSRPSQLLLIGVVYLTGVAAARASGTVDAEAATVGLCLVLLVAASVHYANEYADAEVDALTRRTAFSGGSGALSRSGLSRRVALAAATATGLAGLGAGLAAVALGSIPPIGLLLLGVGTIAGWLYSLPPALALSRRGLGEVSNALLGGLLLPVYGYAVSGGSVPAWIVAAFLPFALVDLANVLATSWPDRQADAAVGKRTLATRRSAVWLRSVNVVALLLAGTLTVAMVGRAYPPSVAAASLAVAPVAAFAAMRFTRVESPLWPVATMVGLIALQLVAWSLIPPGSWNAAA